MAAGNNAAVGRQRVPNPSPNLRRPRVTPPRRRRRVSQTTAPFPAGQLAPGSCHPGPTRGDFATPPAGGEVQQRCPTACLPPHVSCRRKGKKTKAHLQRLDGDVVWRCFSACRRSKFIARLRSQDRIQDRVRDRPVNRISSRLLRKLFFNFVTHWLVIKISI